MGKGGGGGSTCNAYATATAVLVASGCLWRTASVCGPMCVVSFTIEAPHLSTKCLHSITVLRTLNSCCDDEGQLRL